jgi:hypothetical protein
MGMLETIPQMGMVGKVFSKETSRPAGLERFFGTANW